MDEGTHDLWDIRFVNRILNSMADGVFTLDAEGRITSWNRSMERISGYSSEESLGRTCQLLQCSHCFGKTCPSGFEECGILYKEPFEAKECQVRHKNGHEVSVIKNASVVRDRNGKAIGVVETLTDLTELNQARDRAEEARLRLAEIHRMDNLIGKSRAMQRVFSAIRAAAASDVTILVQGESGTGKELVAGAIHFNSARKDHPLVVVNCSALSETILESELFGHVKGAYTGAIRDRIGRFEQANGGTLFLDEIGELTPFIQVKLLRVLQERVIERVGESKQRNIDIRIITATHRDLYTMVREGRFREDLYYRLKVFPIQLPPLRRRREDIPLLVSHFLKTMNEKTGKHIQNVSQSAMRMLIDYPWPGNVRELENAIEHAFVLCNRESIEPMDLPIEILRPGQSVKCGSLPEEPRRPAVRRKTLTRETLLEQLDRCGWNKAEVARQVGLSRTAIWKYMKKWNIPLRGEEG